jgi:hypothetical protein
MTRASAWVGAGLFTAGVSAAMLLGAGTANAEQDGAPKQDSSPAAAKSDATQRPHVANRRAKPEAAEAQATTAVDRVITKQRKTASVASAAESDPPSGQHAASAPARPRNPVREATRDLRNAVRDMRNATHSAVDDAVRNVAGHAPTAIPARQTVDDRPVVGPGSAVEPVDSQTATPPPTAIESTNPAPSARVESVASGVRTRPDPVDAVHDIWGSLGGLILNPEPQRYPKPLSVLTDVVFGTLATLERIAGGDPVVAPALRDSIEVSTSTLVIAPGHEVEANWYLPKDGSTPDRLIYLQHGFLANGPIYSYTASYLADLTDSIVVTTTFSSNPFEADGMWLGGDELHKAVAELFLDPDRRALDASMNTAELKAGRPGDIALPTEFVLVGHSLGGGFAPGVAGYYAAGLVARREAGENAPNDLAGVVIYDAVPIGSIVPDAMEHLDALEAEDPDDQGEDYIPIYEIGAPLNYLNSFSDINAQLSQARPGQFTGVVLEGGQHSDPMQGGNPLIQFALYLAAGFPQPQNPLAARQLSAGWINDMFDDTIDPATGACEAGAACSGQYGDGDDSFTISTAEGDAVAVLIGSKKAADLASLRAISLLDFVAAVPAGVLNGLETTCGLVVGTHCPI